MTISVFDLDDEAGEERFLDWLCHHLYATNQPVRQLVDGGRAPTIVVHLKPRSTPFDPAKTRLLVSIIHGATIQVMDEWTASGTASEPRIVRDIFRDFGFSKEERALAGQRAEKELGAQRLS